MLRNRLVRIGLVFVAITLSLLQPSDTAADDPFSGWSFPLPLGKYKIEQGDKDSKCTSHCAGSGAWNEFALDIVQADGGPDKIRGVPVLAPAPGKVIESGHDRG